jgi:NAD(P)-dependent dehydrogenase (short-subunit alcohol dehydrogenase family)
MQFHGKTAIITGASSGIGKAVAPKLGEQGANICVNYYSENYLLNAQAIAAQIEKSGGKAICIEADMAKIADVKRMLDETINHFGALDILINNAAYAFLKPIEEITEEEYDYIFDVNVKGVFFAC